MGYTADAMASARKTRVHRSRVNLGRLNIVQLGLKTRSLTDLYYFFLRTSWLVAIAILAGGFLLANVMFAACYVACGDCITNARPGSFLDAFFFSVQTIATIGYGTMVPRGLLGNAIVCVEVFTGLLGLALVTGLAFAKFSRPTSRVIFSRVAVITRRNGRPCLMLRIANERLNRIVEAVVHVTFARNEITAEGEQLRRMYDLQLERERSALFQISWTVVHPITDKSPLHGQTPESLGEESAQIIVSLTGLDETFSQTVHARYSYSPAEIVADARFVDIFSEMPDGTTRVDYTRFHDYVPMTEPREAGRTLKG
jgi:inward rectifier potassium channel